MGLMDLLPELPQNRFAGKSQRKFAIKFPRLPTKMSPGSNAVMFQILSADVQERKCQITQRPVQESVSRKHCRIQYRKDCKTVQDTRKQCNTVQDKQCYNVPELKCVNVPRTVQETVHEEQCSTEYDQECSTRYESKCEPVMEKKCTTNTEAKCDVVNEKQCKTVQDEV